MEAIGPVTVQVVRKRALAEKTTEAKRGTCPVTECVKTVINGTRMKLTVTDEGY